MAKRFSRKNEPHFSDRTKRTRSRNRVPKKKATQATCAAKVFDSGIKLFFLIVGFIVLAGLFGGGW